MKLILVCFLTVMCICGASCGKSAMTPTPVPPATPVPPQLTHLNVIGNRSFTAIGQTSQLTATATFSDGVTKDVTADTRWESTDSSVMAVSATGLLSVVRLGTILVVAHYQGATATLAVTATPSGTFVISGGVDEPGQGGVDDLRVTDPASLISTKTSAGGLFSLAGLPLNQVHLRLEKTGYEPAELDATAVASSNGRVQQMIRFTAGETVTPHRLAPHDLTYAVSADQTCMSCRLIRVVVPSKGTLHIRLTWPLDCVAALGLWIGGRHAVASSAATAEVDADVVADAGEMIFYVDRVSPSTTACHVPFKLATSLTAEITIGRGDP